MKVKKLKEKKKRIMTNLLALCLVFTSLFVAEVWSPSPVVKQKGNQVEDVIEKEGHRVIVVETYDQDGHHNTKVSISPEQLQEGKRKPGVVESVKEKFRGTSEHEQEPQPSGEKHSSAREVICDAFGKCTERIAKVIDKAKGKASEKAHQVVDQEKEMVREAKKKAQERVHEAKETVEDAYERVRDSVAHKAQEVKDTTKQKAKEAVKSVSDKGKTIGRDVSSKMSDEAKEAKEKVAEKAEAAREHAKNWFTRCLHWAGRYVTSHETMVAFMGVLNLLGFGIAYGTCVWITFVSSYVLARALPKQQFGLVQSKIYPAYFAAMAYSIGLALFAHLMGQGKLLFTHKAQMLQAFNLMAAIVLVLVNLFYYEPLATKTMIERLKIEKEEGRGRESLSTEETGRADVRQPVVEPSATAQTTRSTEEPPSAVSERAEERQQEEIRSRVANINNRLRTLNSYSSLLNILTLMALTWHLVYLGNRLHVHEAC